MVTDQPTDGLTAHSLLVNPLRLRPARNQVRGRSSLPSSLQPEPPKKHGWLPSMTDAPPEVSKLREEGREGDTARQLRFPRTFKELGRLCDLTLSRAASFLKETLQNEKSQLVTLPAW